jgi:hypothetical protein
MSKIYGNPSGWEDAYMYAFGRHLDELLLLRCFSNPQGPPSLRWRSRICCEQFSAPRRRPPTMVGTNGPRGFRSSSLPWVVVLVLVTSSDMYADLDISDAAQYLADTDLTQPSQVYNNFGLQWFIPYFIGIITTTLHGTLYEHQH